MAEAVAEWSSYFDDVSQFLEGAEQQYGIANENFCEYVLERLQLCIRTCSSLSDHLASASDIVPGIDDRDVAIIEEYQATISELLCCLRSLQQQWIEYKGIIDATSCDFAFHAETERRGRGRPRFSIGRDQLEYLVSLSFNWSEIATLFGVSRMTIYRRRAEFGMLYDPASTVTDADLRALVIQMQSESPTLGESMVAGRLRASGYKVTRERIRNTLRDIDPLSAAQRWPGGLSRRCPYSVAGPNSLWHIDSHHKLIRWRIVTHGCIDGYSRLITFLKCSDNNRATTVYELFLSAVQQHQLPSRVRTDQGGENVLVAQHMIERRGAERRSVITGSSVHNQRIERLWRDMHRCVTLLFYKLFYFMEYHDLLDPLNEQHLYAILYVFIPRINHALSEFMQGWNHHPIRTAHNKSPQQLFTAGALLLQHSGLVALDFFDTVDATYDDGPVPLDEGAVVVPEVTLRLSEEDFAQLQQVVNPLAASEDCGIDLYERTLQFIRSLPH